MEMPARPRSSRRRARYTSPLENVPSASGSMMPSSTSRSTNEDPPPARSASSVADKRGTSRCPGSPTRDMRLVDRGGLGPVRPPPDVGAERHLELVRRLHLALDEVGRLLDPIRGDLEDEPVVDGEQHP